MRNIEYITNGFGGLADLFNSPAFKQYQYESGSPSGPYGASLQNARKVLTPAESIQSDLIGAGYPQLLANTAFSLVNRYGPSALRAPYAFVYDYRQSMFNFSRNPSGILIGNQVDRLGLDQIVPIEITKALQDIAKQSFKSALFLTQSARPYNQTVETFLMQIIKYTIAQFESNITVRQLDQLDLKKLFYIFQNSLSHYKA